jgi:hypothetical protein
MTLSPRPSASTPALLVAPDARRPTDPSARPQSPADFGKTLRERASERSEHERSPRTERPEPRRSRGDDQPDGRTPEPAPEAVAVPPQPAPSLAPPAADTVDAAPSETAPAAAEPAAIPGADALIALLGDGDGAPIATPEQVKALEEHLKAALEGAPPPGENPVAPRSNDGVPDVAPTSVEGHTAPVAAGKETRTAPPGATGEPTGAPSPLAAASPAAPGEPTAVAAEKKAQAPRPTLAPELAESIVSIAHTLRPGGRSEVRIRLDPPSLGELHVQIESSDDGISVRIVAQTQEALLLLRDQRLPLADELARQNIRMDAFSTALAGDGGSRGEHRPSAPFSSSPGDTPRHPGSLAESAARPVAAPTSPGRLDTRA